MQSRTLGDKDGREGAGTVRLLDRPLGEREVGHGKRRSERRREVGRWPGSHEAMVVKRDRPWEALEESCPLGEREVRAMVVNAAVLL